MTAVTIPSAPVYALEGIILFATLYSAVSYTRYYMPYLREGCK